MVDIINAKWIETLPVKTRESFISLAKCLEQAKMFDSMAACMIKVAEFDSELNVNERTLFLMAFKNAIASRRKSCRVLSTSLAQTQDAGETTVIKDYYDVLQNELDGICSCVLKLLEKELFPFCSTAEDKVFYKKMIGDYYRFMAENAHRENHERIVDAALAAYEEATEIAEENLNVGHPIRVALLLNYTVFHNEIMKNSEAAIQIAKRIHNIDWNAVYDTDRDYYDESTFISIFLEDYLKALDKQSP